MTPKGQAKKKKKKKKQTLASHTWGEDLLFSLYRELSQLRHKATNNPIFKQATALRRHFSKADSLWPGAQDSSNETRDSDECWHRKGDLRTLLHCE